ncbi:hypothetical protein M758_1G126400 [Ceratodon purpureus]|uniref:Uncharacterized protein n=1 Tax=Ceratodon purpureus TaxID=3225 RepID=A0A8T0J7M5_CERPU|nr:hypothetical protein KC19_1G130700 [Ceratodon purpureus]KAG0629741.1 hypothetical protein M758_1G126400 [Ceratodon purpureus]
MESLHGKSQSPGVAVASRHPRKLIYELLQNLMVDLLGIVTTMFYWVRAEGDSGILKLPVFTFV